MNRILVVNVNWVGDVVFSSPVFKALKTAYPQSHISCLAVPRVKDVLSCIPAIDEIIIYDEDGKHHNIFAKLKLIRKLKQKRFDVAFLLHRSLTRALLVFLSNIPQRVGYDEKRRGFLLTHRVPQLQNGVHRSDHYLNVIESFGVDVKDRRTELIVSSEAQNDVNTLLKQYSIKKEDYLVVVNPGGNWDLKRWPIDKFGLITNDLINRYKATVVITGAGKDSDLAKEISDYVLRKDKLINFTGKTDLNQLIALIEKADLMISADSGPLHIANSVGTTVIGLFGPTRPEVTGTCGTAQSFIVQHDVGCNTKPCYYLQCPDNVCMQSITVEDVHHVLRQIKNS